MAPTNTDRAQTKGKRTRERLLAAAHDVFAERGYPEARVADITARAGTSHGTFYTYFKDKRSVMQVLAERLFGSLSERALSQLGGAPEALSPRSVIGHRTREYLALYRAEWRFLRAWVQASAIHPELEQERIRIQNENADEIATILREAQEQGLISARIDIEVAVLVLTRGVEEFAERWLSSGRELDEDVAEQLTALWVWALGVEEEVGNVPVAPPPRGRRP